MLAVVAALSAGSLRHARADTVDECVGAVASGQKEQRAGALRAARASFLSCDKVECPAQVRGVCDSLLTSVEASLPTVIFGARDALGSDLVTVRVLVDGVEAAASLDGKAVPIDPGPHSLRFERAGSAPIEQRAVIRESEKNRMFLVTFPPPEGVPGKSGEGTARGRPVPVVAYVLAGAGVASLGVFTALDVNGQSVYDTCKSGCSSSTKSGLTTERDVALTLGGVGIVSLGVATWLFLTRPAEAHATSGLALDVNGTIGGGTLGVRGSF